MSTDCKVTVHDPERRAEFERVFGTATVCVTGPLPFMARMPVVGRQLVYLLDLAVLTGEQRERLVRHLADTFMVPVAQAAILLEAEGVPILASDTSIMVLNPQRWLLL